MVQAPLYPSEVRHLVAEKYNSTLDPQAESKGASATQYGLVFGMFELTVFLVSPVVARLVAKVVDIHLVQYPSNSLRLASAEPSLEVSSPR